MDRQAARRERSAPSRATAAPPPVEPPTEPPRRGRIGAGGRSSPRSSPSRWSWSAGHRARRHPRRGTGAAVPAAGRARRVVGRPALGRGAPRRDPPRAAEPARPRPQPVPHVGRDVGRLGGLRPDRRGLHRHTRSTRASDVAAARNEAISYAAYRVLAARFIKAVGGAESLSEFADVMDSLCYPLDVTTTEGDSPGRGRQPDRGGGHRLRPRRTARTRRTATPRPTTSRSTRRWSSPGPAPTMTDPNRWQPLQLEHMISQNGIPVDERRPAGGRAALGPRQGLRAARRRRRPARRSIPGRRRGSAIRVDRPGLQGPGASRSSATAAALDPTDADDDRHLARRARRQHARHERRHGPPGQPGHRPAVRARRVNARRLLPGDGRVLGRRPEVRDAARPLERLANARLGRARRRTCGSAARAPTVDRLQWDVKLYLALNGAVHDAAIAAWGLKGDYDSVAPDLDDPLHGAASASRAIRRCRRTTRRACRSCPGLDRADHAARRPRPGSATRRSPATRARSPIRAWAGNPTDPKTRDQRRRLDPRRRTGCPYQLPTFVTPAFQGYVSGHSTFSRAAAEVLTGFTGSEYFPGGLERGTRSRPARSSSRRARRTDVTLAWATYYDAADQAGQSRLYGGIHIQADDFNGPDDRLAVRQGRVGARAAVLRGAGSAVIAAALSDRRRDRCGAPPCLRSSRSSSLGGRARGVAAVAVGVLRSADAPTTALGAAAFRRRDGRRRASTHVLRRLRVRSRRAAASPCSTATATAGPTSTSPAGAARGALPQRRAPSAARCGSRRSTTRPRDLPMSPAPTRSTSTATATTDLAVLRDRRERRCSAGSATAGSSARTRRWGFDGGDALDDRVQRDLGGRRALPTLAFGNYLGSTPTARVDRSTCAPTTSSSGPTPTGHALRRADRR